MEIPSSGLEVLAARVERLEKQNRLLKRGGLAALVATASLIAMGQARPSRTVEAQRYVLSDAGGGKRAELALESASPRSSASPTLRFFDEKGTETLFLSSARLELSERSDLGANILLTDKQGVARADLGLTDGQPFVLLNDAKGSSRIRVQLNSDQPSIVLQDAKEVPRLGLSVINDQPRVGLDDLEGFSAALGSTNLVTTSTGQQRHTPAASLVLFGKDGSVLWSAP
jgi:hypothetical protein